MERQLVLLFYLLLTATGDLVNVIFHFLESCYLGCYLADSVSFCVALFLYNQGLSTHLFTFLL